MTLSDFPKSRVTRQDIPRPSTTDPYGPSAVVEDFDVVQYTLPQTAGSTRQFLNGNSNRFALYFQSTVASGVFTWGWTNTTNNNEMTGLVANAPPLYLTFRDIGPLICQPAYYRSSAPGFNIIVFEISYRPRR